MAYLLDTCTISEITKESPNDNVVAWFAGREETRLFLSVVTLGEIEKGILGLRITRKRLRLEKWWYNDILPDFLGRILEISQRTMSAWARLNVNLNAQGIVRPSFDSILEATALEHDLILVTRNVRNFKESPVTILNPWEN